MVLATLRGDVNERDHVANAVLLAIGIGAVLAPGFDAGTLRRIAQYGVPILLGAMVPDIDTSVGDHRKTFHNLATLGVFAAYPVLFSNLHHVWIGVATHYVLDLLGNVRGMALFYPWRHEFDVPVGVTVDSNWATAVTVLVTGAEVAVVYAVVAVDLIGRVTRIVAAVPI